MFVFNRCLYLTVTLLEFLFLCGHPPIMPCFSGVPQGLSSFGVHHDIVHACAAALHSLLTTSNPVVNAASTFSCATFLVQKIKTLSLSFLFSFFIFYLGIRISIIPLCSECSMNKALHTHSRKHMCTHTQAYTHTHIQIKWTKITRRSKLCYAIDLWYLKFHK